MIQNNQQPPPNDLSRSPTVSKAIRRPQRRDPVSAAALTNAILKRRSEYSGHKTSAAALDEPPADQNRPVQEWLADIRSLFDLSRAPELHGRLVIKGYSDL